MTVASPRQRDAMYEAGRALVSLLSPLADDHTDQPATDDDWSDAFGRVLLTAALFAGDDEERLNRLQMLFGVGYAIGELAASWPHLAQGFFTAVNAGVAEGHQVTAKALTPVGRA